jgi:hypothetical protein
MVHLADLGALVLVIFLVDAQGICPNDPVLLDLSKTFEGIVQVLRHWNRCLSRLVDDVR